MHVGLGMVPLFSIPNPGKTKLILKHGKGAVSRIMQIITGHYFMGYYQNKIDSNIKPMCRQCGKTNETFSHLLVQCDALEVIRRSIFMGDLIDANTWKPKNLLEFSYREPISSLSTDALSDGTAAI